MNFFGVAALVSLSLAGAAGAAEEHIVADATVLLQSVAAAQGEPSQDRPHRGDPGDEVHVTFTLDCRPFNLWQHEMLFHSARLVGQRGPITAIISGCSDEERAHLQERHRVLNWPEQFTQYFVQRFNDARSEWLSKPFGFQQWYSSSGPARDVVAVVDPDFVFVRPLTAKLDTSVLPLEWKEPAPSRVQKGVVVAQRYGIVVPVGATGFGGNGSSPWHLDFGGGNLSDDDFLTWVCSGDANGESGCRGLTKYEMGTFHASGVPYIAHRDDWDWLAPGWASITARLHEHSPSGYYVDMFGWSLANAHKGHRQFMMNNLMLSDTTSPDVCEDWSGVDASRVDMCYTDIEDVLRSVQRTGHHRLPHFLHYCQGARVPYEGFGPQDDGRMFSKYWFDVGLPSGQPHVLERCQSTERSPVVGERPGLRWLKSAPPRRAEPNETMTVQERRSRFMGCAVKALFKSTVQATCAGQPLAKDVLEERDPIETSRITKDLRRREEGARA